jgi:hypothetical protein
MVRFGPVKERKRMVSAKNFAYCGIDCDACSVRRHGLTGSNDDFIVCCKGIPDSELACDGCRTDVLYSGCRMCTIRDCAKNKGLTHCGECTAFPCKTYRQWLTMKKLLPHITDSPRNLEMLMENDPDRFAAMQARSWTCPDCGTAFSWYARTCSTCGRDLSDKSFRMKRIGRLVCRFMLPTVYRRGKKQAPKNKTP